MSIEAESVEHKVEVEDLLMNIIEQLKITNMHLSIISDEQITKDDINE